MLTDDFFVKLQESFEKLPIWGQLADDSIKNARKSIKEIFSTLGIVNAEKLTGNENFFSILTSYLILAICVRRLIARMSKHKGDDDANLTKLSVVEIETRALLLKAHIARLVEERAGDDFAQLLGEGKTAISALLPEVAEFQSRLLINGAAEVDEVFTSELVFQQNLVSLLIRDTIN